MTRYKLHITAVGENGEESSSTIEKEGESEEQVVQSYLDAVNEIVEYWDITVEEVTKVDR